MKSARLKGSRVFDASHPAVEQFLSARSMYVLGWGPGGTGKCHVATDTVVTASGSLKPIGAMAEDVVVTIGQDGRARQTRSLPTETFPAQPCLTIETWSGYQITVNQDHPLLTIQGWTPAARLSVNDSIATLRNCPVEGRALLPADIPAFAGMMLEDGR